MWINILLDAGNRKNVLPCDTRNLTRRVILNEVKNLIEFLRLRSGQSSGFALRMTVMLSSVKICVQYFLFSPFPKFPHLSLIFLFFCLCKSVAKYFLFPLPHPTTYPSPPVRHF